jgi:CMP-N-acetylneuraminic acid synthetase
MKIIAIIPARGGSKGIPRKNLVPIKGKPLLAYSIEAALEAHCFDLVLVSTDDEEIAGVARGLGAQVPFLRSPELAGDKAKTVDAIIECLDRLEQTYDAVCLLQPTAPLRSVDDILQSIDVFLQEECDSLVSVCRLEEPHPYKLKSIDDGYVVPFIPGSGSEIPRQDLPPAYMLTGAIYIIKVDVLKAKKSFFGDKTVPYFMPEERSVNIDSVKDIYLTEYYLRNL